MQPSFKESVKAQHFQFFVKKKTKFKILKCNEVKTTTEFMDFNILVLKWQQNVLYFVEDNMKILFEKLFLMMLT